MNQLKWRYRSARAPLTPPPPPIRIRIRTHAHKRTYLCGFYILLFEFLEKGSWSFIPFVCYQVNITYGIYSLPFVYTEVRVRVRACVRVRVRVLVLFNCPFAEVCFLPGYHGIVYSPYLPSYSSNICFF